MDIADQMQHPAKGHGTFCHRGISISQHGSIVVDAGDYVVYLLLGADGFPARAIDVGKRFNANVDIALKRRRVPYPSTIGIVPARPIISLPLAVRQTPCDVWPVSGLPQ